MSNDIDINFSAPPVLAEFMRDNSRVRFVRGPIGSGKSTAMAMELFRRMLEQEPGPDGYRRTQMAVVRNTGNQLRTTCLATIMQLFGQLARWKPSTAEVIFEFGDVRSTWLLLPLDTPDNVRRLLSLELTMAWVSEAREVAPSIVNDVYSRCGRFPSKINGGPTFYGLIAETNSFSEDSPWNDMVEIDLPKNWGYFVQPPGFTLIDEDNIHEFGEGYGLGDIIQTGENAENLPDTYYTDQIEANGGIDAPWVRQYLGNEIAPSVAGEAVFKHSFYWDFHVSKKGLEPNPTLPLCVGLDTGRNPSAVITQIDPRGRMLVLGECWGENCGMEIFIEEMFSPLMYTKRYNGIPIYMVIDPAGVQRSQIGEESVLMALRRMGFSAVTATTNNIQPRLRSVEKWLQQANGGSAAMLFDEEHCPTLLLSMSARYRYRRKKDGTLEDAKPEKNHPYSDLADALQYACLGGATAVRAKAMRILNRERNERHDPMPSGAWT
jgi:hypothetical protein